MTLDYSGKRAAKRLSRLAVVAAIWGIVGGPIAVGVARCVRSFEITSIAPGFLAIACLMPLFVGVLASVVALARTVPGIARVRGVPYAVVGLVASVLSLGLGGYVI